MLEKGDIVLIVLDTKCNVYDSEVIKFNGLPATVVDAKTKICSFSQRSKVEYTLDIDNEKYIWYESELILIMSNRLKQYVLDKI